MQGMPASMFGCLKDGSCIRYNDTAYTRLCVSGPSAMTKPFCPFLHEHVLSYIIKNVVMWYSRCDLRSIL